MALGGFLSARQAAVVQGDGREAGIDVQDVRSSGMRSHPTRGIGERSFPTFLFLQLPPGGCSEVLPSLPCTLTGRSLACPPGCPFGVLPVKTSCG